MNSELDRRKWEHKQRVQSVERLLWKCCLNCEFFAQRLQFDENGIEKPSIPYCGKFESTPPLKFIVTGCHEHLDAIPF